MLQKRLLNRTLQEFSITGICPLNTKMLNEDEFLSLFVTDRPETDIANEVVG